LKVSESTLRRRLLESGVQLNPRQLGGDEIAVKVRKSRRKPRPVKVIERVEARYEQPADVWGKEPWTETPQGKVEGEDKPAKTRGGGRRANTFTPLLMSMTRIRCRRFTNTSADYSSKNLNEMA